MYSLLLAGLLSLAPAPPVSVNVPADAGLVVRRGSYTLTLRDDRLEVRMDGQPFPTVFLLSTAPGPGPNPDVIIDPPRPVDPPTPTKIEKLRVVLVVDQLAPLTPQQQAVFVSPAVADYLNAHCFGDGATRAWRRWDAKVTTTDAETTGWRAAAELLRKDPKPAPKLMIFDDTRLVASEPLPSDEAAALALLKKYGGD